MEIIKLKELWKEKQEDKTWRENIIYLDVKKIWCIMKTNEKKMWKVWLDVSFDNNQHSILIGEKDKDTILKMLKKDN